MVLEQKNIELLDFETKIELLKKERFMYPHFVEGIVSGQFQEMPDEDIEKIVNENFFGFEPLTKLTPEEEGLLKKNVFQNLKSAINRDEFKKLCEKNIYYDDAKTICDDSALEWATKETNNAMRPTTKKERLSLLTDASRWKNLRFYSGNLSSELTFYGNRNLVGKYDEYFHSEEEFKSLIKDARARSNVDKARVLDIGCGMGKALQDMKGIEPNIETHGITVEQEPGMFKSDFFHYVAAERMPETLKNKFHLILSQISSRYFLFQNIALRNIISSLAKGGAARIGFGYDRVPDEDDFRKYFQKMVPGSESSYDAMKVLVGQEFEKLEKLAETGKLKITTNPEFREHDYQGFLLIEKLEDIDDKELS